MSRLRKYRKALNLSQAQLGEAAGTYQAEIFKLEHGKPMRAERAVDLAPHLACHWTELMSDKVPKITLEDQEFIDRFHRFDTTRRALVLDFMELLERHGKPAPEG